MAVYTSREQVSVAKAKIEQGQAAMPAAGTIKNNAESLVEIIEILRYVYHTQEGATKYKNLKSIVDGINSTSVESSIDTVKNVKIHTDTILE